MGDQIFDWLVIDHYGIDRRWQQQMKGATRRSLILDDLADRHHDADLLVDGASVPGRYGGKVGDDCKLLLGPRFALLRNEFVDIREAALDRRWQTEGRICNVVIGYGGVDQDNLTRRALDAWEAISPFDMELEVLIGEAHPARAAIEERCAATAGVECMVEAPDMASRMARADLALGAAGVMSWERCVVGLPTILTQVADNQSEIAGRVERAGAGLLLGSAKETTSTALRKALQGLCRQPARVAAMGRAAASLTDGRGVTRVIDEMLLLGGSSS